MSLSTDLTNSINAIKADGEKLHAIVHGTATDVIATDGGNVNSLAKTMRDLFADAETIFDDMRSAVTDANPWGSVDGKSWDTVTWAGNKPATLAHSTATDSGEDAMMTVAIPADTARVRFRADIAGAYNWGGNGGMAPHLVLLDSEFNIILKSTPSVEYWTNGCQLLPGLQLDTSVACPAGTRYLAIYFDTGADGHGSYSGTMTYSVALTNMHVTTSTSVTIETLTSRAQAAQTAKTLTEGYRDAAWVAKLSAESSSAGANAAKLSAQEHRDDALTAKNAADTHANNAGIAAGAAQTSADNASGHATSAQTSAGNAQTYEGNAYTSSVNAADYEVNASTSKTNAASYEAAAYTAMVNAGNSNKVATDDLRLGLRGGVALPKSATSSDGRLSPVASWPLGTLSVNFPDGYAADPERPRFLGGSTTTSGDNCWLVYGLANGKVRLKAGSQNSSEVTVPAGTKWTHLVYDRTANTLSLYCNDSTTALVSITRTPTTPLDNCVAPVGGWGGQDWSYAGRVGAVVALNYAASHADRIAAMRGEYPQAWVGGTVTSPTFSGACTNNSWPTDDVAGNVTTNSGGTLAAWSTGATAAGAITCVAYDAVNPLIGPGRVVRLRYSLTLNSGLAPKFRLQQGNIDAIVQFQAGASVVQDVTCTVLGHVSDSRLLLRLQTDGETSFVLSNLSVEILGAQILVGPSDWTRTRGMDLSGNANDLIYGSGVVALEPASKVRVIPATVAGATITATNYVGIGSIGALTGADYRGAKALAALRQWDAVRANWRQARPTYCGALQAAVTAHGTPLVEATATGGNCTVSANAAINLVHEIN